MNGINLIYRPSIYLVGRPGIASDGLARFLSDQGVADWQTDTPVPAETLVEVAGRLCYLSFARPRPGGNAAYIGHILDVGHGSVIEHAVFNFIVTGVSRSLTHELVRHRVGFSYSQLSQRFVDESGCAFVVPPALADEVGQFDEEYNLNGMGDCPNDNSFWAASAWYESVWLAMCNYRQLSDYLFTKYADMPDRTARRKAAREAARSVLPNCTETKIFVTANARALRHFIELRGDPAADAEIRRLAACLLNVLRDESPSIFGDMEVIQRPGGGHAVQSRHRKV